MDPPYDVRDPTDDPGSEIDLGLFDDPPYDVRDPTDDPGSEIDLGLGSLFRDSLFTESGLIAQQAREVNPVFYHESAGIGNIAQYPLIIALVKSVQELSERIKVLENAAVH